MPNNDPQTPNTANFYIAAQLGLFDPPTTSTPADIITTQTPPNPTATTQIPETSHQTIPAA